VEKVKKVVNKRVVVLEVIKEIFNNFTASLTIQDVQVFLGKKGYFVSSEITRMYCRELVASKYLVSNKVKRIDGKKMYFQYEFLKNKEV